jgi:hypothetical protein
MTDGKVAAAVELPISEAEESSQAEGQFAA